MPDPPVLSAWTTPGCSEHPTVRARIKAATRRSIARLLRSIYRSSTAGQAAPVPDQATQRLLWMHYQELIKLGRPLPPFGVAGFRAYSQNEEDGILLLLFAALGVTNRVCADIGFCVADGANTTNLICNWGWEGFLVEGDPVRAQATRTFFATNRDAANWPPRLVESWG